MRSSILLAAALWLLPAVAQAHLGLNTPTSRYGSGVLKNGPCGRLNGLRSANITTCRPGETIMVQWDEYINHPGNFRIAFDDDGDDDFVDPPCTANCNTTNPTLTFNTSSTILLDNITDTNGGLTTMFLTLPNIECSNCTLQVIQVMYDKPPFTSGGDDIYYQCADLVLSNSAGPNCTVAPPVDAGTPDAGTPIDAGTPDDSGPVPDTGPAPDGGTNPVDAGTPDLGGPGPGLDAGTAGDDAAVAMGSDGGLTAADGSMGLSNLNSELRGSCGCNTRVARGAGLSTPLLLCGLLLLYKSRR